MRPIIPVSVLIAPLFVAIGSQAVVASAERLKPAFDISARQAMIGKPSDGFTCEPPPAPVRDLTFGGFYRQGTGSSEVDRNAMRAYREARKPVDRFANAVIKMGDLYVASHPADTDIARCVLDWLHRWAEGQAYLGEVSHQGGFVRKWALGTISLAFLKVRDAAGLDAEKVKAVKQWIGGWARLVRDDYSSDLHKSSRNNNHAYWAASSVGLAAVVLDDRAHFGWMIDRYRAAVRHIREDGTLGLELDRRSKALHYHLFSVQALVQIAELGAANGEKLYEAADGALHRLIRRTVDGLTDPAYFEQLTGAKQGWVGKLDGGKLAWMELYYARFRTPALEPWIRRFRPMKNRRVGGNATLLYGVMSFDGNQRP